MTKKYTRLKLACYATNISMAIVANFPPLLFMTFRSLYGISYTLLGLLVLINFCTQLAVDLIFSFFSHKFNIPATVKYTPLLTVAGLIVYAVWPWIFQDSVYLGLVIGTIIFSASSGLYEVLLSPVVAAIPAEDPDRQMSKLHSVYAWAVVCVILITTAFLLIFPNEYWQFLVLIFSFVPLTAFVLFCGVEIPQMVAPERMSGVIKQLKNKTLWLCVLAIFLGGAAECTMAQWCSSYLEMSLGIPKLWGDLLGVAFFAVMLGCGRTLYAKIGKNISKVLLLGIIGATFGYFIAATVNVPAIALLACGITGLCTSMLWPGSLIIASERIPTGGVFLFAMMAAGGDFGASVGPQAVGVITDAAISSPQIAALAESISLTAEQLGMKIGMLAGMLFPALGIYVFYRIHRSRKCNRLEK